MILGTKVLLSLGSLFVVLCLVFFVWCFQCYSPSRDFAALRFVVLKDQADKSLFLCKLLHSHRLSFAPSPLSQVAPSQKSLHLQVSQSHPHPIAIVAEVAEVALSPSRLSRPIAKVFLKKHSKISFFFRIFVIIKNESSRV